MTAAEIVQAMFDAYLQQDRATAEALLADDFTFTSPQDDHIHRAAFLERCFPTASRVSSQRILDLVEGDQGVFILYEYVLRDGSGRFRNAEHISVHDGRIRETQVFFGGRY